MERCNEHIKDANPDPDRIYSLVKIATARIKALNQIKADEETASIIVEQHYEAIKELLTALLLKDGKKSSSHECLIEYFSMKYITLMKLIFCRICGGLEIKLIMKDYS